MTEVILNANENDCQLGSGIALTIFRTDYSDASTSPKSTVLFAVT